MTLVQFITKYNGEKVGDGQCGALVRQYWIEVDKTDPPSYDDSKEYWSNPVPGYDKITSSPQLGDIAIYNGHGVYTEGHSAIYAGNDEVFEQNADPDGSPAHLFKRANTYLLGYLRKQGVETMRPMNTGDRYNLLAWTVGTAKAEEAKTNNWFGTWIGKDYDTAVKGILTSQQYQDWLNAEKVVSPAAVLKPGQYRVN